MDKVLITGGHGFIATALYNKLAKSAEIFRFTRRHNLAEIIDFKPNIIFHLAAEIKKNKDMFQTNVVLTQHLLDIAKNLKDLKAFVNVGSSSEYGRKCKPISESDFLNPDTIYEATKGAASLLCRGYAQTFNLPIITARPFTIYGPNEPDYKLIPTLYNKITQSQVIDLASGIHDFVYIDDFVEGLVLLSQRPAKEIKGEVANFGTGVQTTNSEVLTMMEILLNKKAIVKHVDKMRSYDSDCWVCDPRRTRFIYDWSASTSLEVGLKKYIESRNATL